MLDFFGLLVSVFHMQGNVQNRSCFQLFSPPSPYSCSSLFDKESSLTSPPSLLTLQDFDLGLNDLHGTIPASWPKGMHSLRRLALDSNRRLCGPLPSHWTGSTPSLRVLLTLFTRLDKACTPQHSKLRPRPPSDVIIATLATTIVWPGGDLSDLQQDGGLEEQRFRLRYRR